MPNKLPKMAAAMVERVHIKVGMLLPKTAEKTVTEGIMRFHTGRETWPVSMKPTEIPNFSAADKALKNAKAARYATLVYDIDADGVWYFMGVQ